MDLDAMTCHAGQRLLHYLLVEEIGRGGMGTVWRAKDATLDRDVAIKVLPDEWSFDEGFLARFEREAKILASLTHPSVASVFGVHAVDSTHFLAMEFVAGEDLAERLRRGPLPVEETLAVMGEVAEALEAAHAKAVVHRDLKPANVRLTSDGRVKVLDFGLAKVVGAGGAGDGGRDGQTATGVVLGTPPYMSPEQIRGGPVDNRADVWSFGCVLWECLTGRKPFAGETVPDQVTAILNAEPEWTALPGSLPAPVARLLRRCLAKPPRERLHHIADARIELLDAAAELREGSAPRAELAGGRPARKLAAAPVTAVLGAAGGLLLGALLSGDDAPSGVRRPLENARFTKLTAYPGDELDAAISPDGGFVAFFADKSGRFEPYLGRTSGGEQISLTEGKAHLKRTLKVVPDRVLGTAVRRIGFMDDGEGLWFSGDVGQKLSVLPIVGDQERVWLQEYTIHVDWWGSRIVYSLGSGGDPIFIADGDGGNARPVPLPSYDGYHQHFPTWSPDGRWIYLVRGHVMDGRMALWRVRPDGSGLERLTEDLLDVTYPVPLDERTLLFIARETDGSGPWLWEFDLESRQPRRATKGVEKFTSIASSRDKRRLVATVANPQAGLYSVPILSEGVAREEDVEPFPLPAVHAQAPRIRGAEVFYLSSMGGSDELWRHGQEGDYPVWKGSGRTRIERPCALSPSGERLAIVVQERSRARLLVMNSDGTEPRAFMDDVAVGGSATWSPDGAWIAAGGERDGARGLFRARVEDGHTELVLAAPAWNPVWSPDGRLIVFAGPQIGPEQILQCVALEGSPPLLGSIRVPARGERVRFLPDGSGLVYLAGQHPSFDFHLLDLSSGRSRRLTETSDSSIIRTFDITADGGSILFDRRRDHSDVVLIERDVAR